MVKYVLFGLMTLMIAGASLPAYAGIERCTGCHNGRVASELKDRFKTEADLIRAAKSTKSPLMGSVRGNEEYLRAAAKDLGLK